MGDIMRQGSKVSPKLVLERLAELRADPESRENQVLAQTANTPRHIKQFFRIARYRKRQILERMLMK